MRSMAAGSRLHRVARTRVARIAAPLLLIAALLGGCLLPPAPKTDAGQDVFNLYVAILVLAGIVFVGVEGFILYAVIRYRRKPGDDELPPQIHGNTMVEVIWTVIPSVIVLILFVLSMITLGEVNARSQEPGVNIEVQGFQWQWSFHYPEGVVVDGTTTEPATMTVPVGEPIHLELVSLDVNHAFFVPDFLLKRDVIQFAEGVPPNELEFTVTEAGTYAGQCAEFCGTSHAQMVFVVEALSRADYDTWFEAAKAGETPVPSAGDCATTIPITAANIQFDIDSFEAPAGEPFCIELRNDDTVPHDVGIYDGGTELFNGEDIDGGETITYQVPALDAGEYRFICNIHPQDMVGDVTITQ